MYKRKYTHIHSQTTHLITFCAKRKQNDRDCIRDKAAKQRKEEKKKRQHESASSALIFRFCLRIQSKIKYKVLDGQKLPELLFLLV